MRYFIYALLSGALLALGWPTYGFPVLLFFAFVPLLLLEYDIRVSTVKNKRLKLLAYSYLSFFIWNFVTTSWLQYADIFGAAFAVLVNSLLMALIILAYHGVAKIRSPMVSLVFLISLWMAFEKLHLAWEFSWPWLNLGNGFSEYYKWIQWYEYTGTFGGTLWIWIVNGTVFFGALKYQIFKNKIILKSTSIKTILLILIPITLSLIRFYTYKTEGKTAEIILLQPNIDPYSDKYQISNEEIGDLLLKLADTEIDENTDFILAPETVFADNVRRSQFNTSRFKNNLDRYISAHPRLNILAGISLIDFVSDPKKVGPQTNNYKDGLWYNDYNSAILLNASDSVAFYNKSKLVVGVENFPYQGFLKPLIGDAMIDLGGTVAMKTTQDYRSVFTGINPDFKAAPIICYESVYGEFVTGYVRNGANFLAIITNDAWWNETQGHKQHLSYARLRAIETRRAVARSANTGISAFINAKGEITSSLAYNKQGALKGQIIVNDNLTFYTKAGDYLARIAIFIAFFVFLISFFRKERK